MSGIEFYARKYCVTIFITVANLHEIWYWENTVTFYDGYSPISIIKNDSIHIVTQYIISPVINT